MGFISIPNQPIQFNQYDTDYCEVVENCAVYQQGDGGVATQIKLLPCNEAYICDGRFESQEEDPTKINFACWEETTGWSYVGSVPNYRLHHSSGNTNTFYYLGTDLINAYTLSNNNYFALRITASNVISGSVEIWFGGVLFGTISSNGTFTFYQLPISSNNLYLVPTNDFVGDLDDFYYESYYIPTNDSIWLSLIDINTNTQLQSNCLSSYWYQNYLQIGFDPSCLDIGCYKIKICEPCALAVPAPFFNSIVSDLYSDGNLNIIQFQNITYNWYSNRLNLYNGNSTSTGFIELLLIIPNFIPNDCCHRIRIYLNLQGTSGQLDYTAGSNCYGSVSFSSSNDYIEFQCCAMPTNGNIDLLFFVNPLETLDIYSIQIRYDLPCLDYEYTDCVYSNCIQILPTANDGTKLIQAWCYDLTYELGFSWFANFILKQRLNLFKFAPSYPIDGKSYIFSDGTKQLTSGQREKNYQFTFKGLDEREHDTLSTQILCTRFKVDGVDYVIDPKDYKPEWDTKSGYNLADVRMEGMKQGTIIFKDNQT